MNILCNDCRHEKVCAFQEKYKETADNLDIELAAPFSVKLECLHYDQKITAPSYLSNLCNSNLGLNTSNLDGLKSV